MVHRFCLVIFYFKEKFCVSHASASRLRDVYCLRPSEDLVEKIISPVIFDIQTVRCSFFNQIIVYQSLTLNKFKSEAE